MAKKVNATKPGKAPAKRRTGRPRLELDLQQVEALGTIQCTDEEIAAVLGCSTDTIGRRKQDDLRRLQWKAAQNGNITMLIWLGKQVLGQRDRMEQASSVKVELDDAGNLDQWDVARAREFLDKTRGAN